MDLNAIKKRKKSDELIFIISFVITIVSFFLSIFDMIFIISFVGSIALLIYTQTRFKKLSVTFKKTNVEREIKKFLDDAIFKPEQGLTKEFVYGSGILKKEDRFSSEDYLSGTIKGKQFRSAEIHLEDVQSNGKTTSVVTVFRGRFFEIDFKKTFENDVYIFPNVSARFNLGRGMERIDVESILFNKAFDVFSKDQNSAFLLLKPRFIEKLLEFHHLYKRVHYGFKKDKVYIAIHTGKDAFDLKMFKRIDETFFKEIKDEITLVENLIDLINN